MKTPALFALFAVLLVTALPAQVPATLNYQGRILQNGQPFEGKGHFVFALYEGPDRIWTNKDLQPGAQLNDPQSAEAGDAMELEVRNGVFSVVLGKAGMVNNRPLELKHFYESAQTPNRVRANMRMEVWFSPVANQTYKKLSPDIEFASVPFAQVAALAATVADGAVGTKQIATNAVGNSQLSSGAVTSEKISDRTIVLTDIAVVAAEQLMPPGGVIAYGGTNEPPGWLLCNGQTVSRTNYPALFLAIGTAHGRGDGTNTFHLPDYRGRFLRGVSGSTNNDPDRLDRQEMNPGGNSNNAVGSVQADQFKNHNHELNSLAGNYGTTATSSGHSRGTGNQAFGVNTITYDRGGNETRPKNAYVNYIIKY